MRTFRALRIPALLIALLAPFLVVAPASAAVAPRYIFTGKAFDACEAQPEATMQAAIRSSPFRAVGIYIDGISRSCEQPNLTAAWVKSVRTQGWALLPTYVGRQAPCTSLPNKINLGAATSQGTAAAEDAVATMKTLGLPTGNPIYLDIENYNRATPNCSAAVKKFLDAWNTRLAARGYVSGVYGSTSSLMVDLVKWLSDSTFDRPGAIWFARWNGVATVLNEPTVPNNKWNPDKRIHQYKANQEWPYGGSKFGYDVNQVDAPAVAPLG